MSQHLGNVLDAIDKALAERPLRYDPLIEAFRALEIPSDINAGALSRMYSACYRILEIEVSELQIDFNAMEDWQHAHLVACARDQIERTMYDPHMSNRAWVERRRKRYIARGEEIPEELQQDQYPPQLNVPWDEATAGARIRPFLEKHEADIVETPTLHFKLCWDVINNGYPVFQRIIARWMRDLESRGVGLGSTVAAFDLAQDLYAKAEEAKPIGWAACVRAILPLLDHDHPMAAAGAARYLGSLYDDAEEAFGDDAETLPLKDILERMRTQAGNRAAIAGGFICGLDIMGDGLDVLRKDGSLEAGGFDLDQWVLDILSHQKGEPDLPNARSFWFYVHEHYCADPVFVTKLVDMDRAWVAMMCATELDERVKGMKPVLERLAVDADSAVADGARRHLKQVYK